MNLEEEDFLEATNHAVLAAVAFMTSSISSLPRWRTRGILEGQLMITSIPEGETDLSYCLVRMGRLFSDMWRALVCAAAVYMVLRK